MLMYRVVTDITHQGAFPQSGGVQRNVQVQRYEAGETPALSGNADSVIDACCL